LNFKNFLIEVEIALDKLHFISETQNQKVSFLWLKFTLNKNIEQEVAKKQYIDYPWINHLLLLKKLIKQW